MDIMLSEAVIRRIVRETLNDILSEDRFDTTATPYNSRSDRTKGLGRNPLVADNGGHSNNDVVSQVSTFDYNGENFRADGRHACVSDNKFIIYKIKNYGSDTIDSTKSVFGSTKELRRAIDQLNGGARRNGKHVMYRTITSVSNKAKSERSDYMVGTFWEFSLNYGRDWYLLVPDPLMKMKLSKLVLNESILTEAADDSFSLQELSSIKSFNKRLQYCKMHLGPSIGKGSSRMVFQLDDEKCLKLAMNQKGIAQNDAEYDWYCDKLAIFPKLYDCDQDMSWIVSEYVLPAKEQDFVECLGMTWKDFNRFISTAFYENKPEYRKRIFMPMSSEQYWKLVEENEDLNAFNDYIGNYNVPIGDFTMIQNYGMALRNGEPTIVMLDHGLNDEILNQYYKH